jgi:hypothetical protein
MKGKEIIITSLRKKKSSDVNKVEEINQSIINKKHKSKAKTYKQRMSSSLEALESNDGKSEGNMQENNEAVRKEKNPL